MRTQINVIGAAALTGLLVLTGCRKESVFGHQPGTQIAFGATTYYENGAWTKTEYSGDLVENNQYERINWIEKDRIRILCDAASLVSGTDKFADYLVENPVHATGDRKSRASIAPVGNGLQWGTGDHYFFALYPSENIDNGWTVPSTASLDAVGADKARISGLIPTLQDASPSDTDARLYKPNMNFAYMYAAQKVSEDATGPVTLPFKPLVTAFEFQIKNDSSNPISGNLTSVTLRSESTPMAGNFTVEIDQDGNRGPVSITGSSQEVGVSLGTDGIALSDDAPVTVTLLALPVDQDELTLELGFKSGDKRTLQLKYNGNWIRVGACQKVYIRNIGVPGQLKDMYYFDVTGPEADFPSGGGTASYSVRSYKRSSGVQVPVAWHAYAFSSDGGTTWYPARPGWFGAETAGNGSVAATAIPITLGANNTLSNKTWHGGFDPINENREDARDLSWYDVRGESFSNRNTANCYVVSKPGWYKIPMVYGNGIRNSVENEASYSSTLTTQYSLTRFVRHDGNPITSPWIKSNGITIRDALLLWQDWDGLVSDVSYEGIEENGFLYFYVSPASIFQGNAVVAARDASGTIVWSWHIWVVDNPAEQLRNITVGTSYILLGKNLGWCDTETVTPADRTLLVRCIQDEEDEEGNQLTAEFSIKQLKGNETFESYGSCTFYQWGRKDPMLPARGDESSSQVGIYYVYTDKPQYPTGGSYLWQYSAEDSPTSLDGAIRSPHIFFRNRSHPRTGNWCTTRYDNLWNRNGGDDGAGNPTKTVYDPSPAGYKVPARNTFQIFAPNSNGVNTATPNASNASSYLRYEADRGLFFYTTGSSTGTTAFFPGVGDRDYASAALNNLKYINVSNNRSGYYWTAAGTIQSGQNNEVGRKLFFWVSPSMQVTASYSDLSVRATGCCIRPVIDSGTN